MLSMYPACFFYEVDSYSIVFPDLNWLATQGDTFEEAIARELDPDAPKCEAAVNMASVDVAAYAKQYFEKSVRKTLTIPARLNTAASGMDISFSQVLQEALIAKVQAQ